VAGDLGGQPSPGLYKSTSSLAISSGDLTLDAQGDPNAVFIFQMASTLTTTSGRQVILTAAPRRPTSFGKSAARRLWERPLSSREHPGFTSITVIPAQRWKAGCWHGMARLLGRQYDYNSRFSNITHFASSAAVTGPFTDAAGSRLISRRRHNGFAVR